MSFMRIRGQQAPILMMLPLESIEPNPDQPRKRFDEGGLRELADSIRMYGVIQPVTVRPEGKGKYQLVAGERRWRAARMAGLREIPATVTSLAQQGGAILAMIENLQRENLHFLEEAEGYAALLREYHLTQETLARHVGKSQSAIANKLRLLRLAPMVRSSIRENGLTERHARALLAVEDPETQLKVAQTAAQRQLTVRQTEELIQQSAKTKPPEPVFAPVKADDALGLFRKGRTVTRFYDPRLFINTMKGAVFSLQKEGYAAQYEENRTDREIEITIRIPAGRKIG